MKALTICQPYAELIARGEKLVENRTWRTPYRGPLLIHAGKSRSWMDAGDDARYPGMTFGAIVAIAELWQCYPAERALALVPDQEHYINGPWCWMLRDVRRLVQPIAIGGQRGLWDFAGEIVL